VPVWTDTAGAPTVLVTTEKAAVKFRPTSTCDRYAVHWFDLRSKRSDRVSAFVFSAIDLSRLTVQILSPAAPRFSPTRFNLPSLLSCFLWSLIASSLWGITRYTLGTFRDMIAIRKETKVDKDRIAQNLACVVSHFHSEAENDVEAALKLYTDDIIFEAAALNGLNRSFSGKEAVAKFYRELWATMADVKFQTLQRFATEDRVVDDSFVTFDVVCDGCWPYFSAGQKIEMRLVHIFEMRDGNIDAAVLPYSFGDVAKRAGFRSLADTGKLKFPYQGPGLCAQREVVANSPDLITRLVKGMVEAVVFIHDPGNKEGVEEVLKKNLRLARREDVETSYGVLRSMTTLDLHVAPDLGAWRTIQALVARVNPKVAQIDMGQIVDGSFVRSLEESRFLPEARKKLGR
jgi:ketosteroid isomerase-like protein